MTTLRDRMHETVDGQHTDLATLVERSRRRGTTLRRRRRLAAAGSALAVVAVVGAGAIVATGALPSGGSSPVAGGGGGGGTAIDQPASHRAKPPKARAGSGTHPADGGSTTAALYAAVTDVLPGTGSDFEGQGAAGGAPDTYGQLAFTPADGSGAGRVGLNLQNASVLADPDTGRSAEDGFVCGAGYMEACQVRTLPDGSLLRTYAEHSATAGGGTGERLVAERLVDHVRVVAASENGFSGPADTWEVTRPDAVLSIDQLTIVVSQPWWRFELPDDFGGTVLVPPYTEIPSS